MASVSLRFSGFGLQELLALGWSELDWWYDLAVEIAENEEEELGNAGRR